MNKRKQMSHSLPLNNKKLYKINPKNVYIVKHRILITNRTVNVQFARNAFRNITIIIFHQIQFVKNAIV